MITIFLQIQYHIKNIVILQFLNYSQNCVCIKVYQQIISANGPYFSRSCSICSAISSRYLYMFLTTEWLHHVIIILFHTSFCILLLYTISETAGYYKYTSQTSTATVNVASAINIHTFCQRQRFHFIKFLSCFMFVLLPLFQDPDNLWFFV